jgi:myo-inositol-1(or 4)-monophosphatase
MTPTQPVRPPLDARALLRVALDAARDAGVLAQAGWRKHPAAEHKGRVDLVTRYDRESEVLLRERLTRDTPFPVVGEESGGDSAPGLEDPTWYVDPIDGTTNFVHGHPFWCVSVGLLAGGRPVLGAIVAPSLGVEWAGTAPDIGGTAIASTRNGEPCAVSEVSRLEDALLATGFPYEREVSPENNFDAFVAIKKKCQAVRRCGSAALDLCLVADGTYDGYWENKLKPWDVAAGAAIVVGAGGRVTDYGGHGVDLTSGQLIATNGRVHDVLVAELGAVVSPRK